MFLKHLLNVSKAK